MSTNHSVDPLCGRGAKDGFLATKENDHTAVHKVGRFAATSRKRPLPSVRP
jgi:hypothetical protein